jgi:hypothetical protein
MHSPDRQGYGYRLLVFGAVASLSLGCTTTLHIDAAVPRPVVEALPLDVGVHYQDSFRDYEFDGEAADDESRWDIELGPAQVRLFDQLFETQFRSVTRVDDLHAILDPARMDMVLEPAIEEYSLRTPWGTGTDFYEVTIRYSLSYYSPGGELIARWPFEGHGRTRSSFFSNDESVEKATIAAMRDAATVLILELRDKPEVKGLLQVKRTRDGKLHKDVDS